MTKLNFGGIDQHFSDAANAQIAILPVPFDQTSTWIKGSDKGPDAILEASENMELYDIETNSSVYERGIYTCSPLKDILSADELVEKVEERVSSLLKDDKFVVTIGGNHSVSIGAIKAHVEKFPYLTVLQLDAHTDLRQDYKDSKNNHACVMARASEWCDIVQVGIRSMCEEEKIYLQKERVFFAHNICKNSAWQEDAIDQLSENVYITIDLDVFDPSVMPSTGTPEPGGMGYYEVLHFLKKVISKVNVVGFDVVELCPRKEDKAPDFLAAKLIYQLLSYKFSQV